MSFVRKINNNVRVNSVGNFIVDGNLGVGTVSPQYALDVSGGARITGGLTTGNINITGNLYQNGELYNPAGQWSGSVGSNIYYTGGNVGIGTTNPTSALTVVGPFSGTTSYTQPTLSTTAFNFQFANRIDGTGNDVVASIATTNDNGVYVGGYYNTDVGFFATNGTTIVSTQSSPLSINMFVTRYTSNGSLMWANRIYARTTIYGIDQSLLPISICNSSVDSGVFAGGYSSAPTVTFFATNGSTEIGSINSNVSSNVISYTAKYTSRGSLLWTAQIDGTGQNAITATCYSSADAGVFVGGFINDTQTNFYAINGVTRVSTIQSIFTNDNSFIAKYNSQGTLLWTSRMEGNFGDYVTSLSNSTVDGGVFVGGCSGSTQLNFYSTNGSTIITTMTPLTTNYMAYLAKYSSSGSLLWTAKLDGTGSDYIQSVSNSSVDGGVYVGGFYFSSQLNFYATNGSTILSTLGNLGSRTAFVAKYASSGSLLWNTRIDGSNDKVTYTVATSNDNGVLVGGRYTSTQVNFYATNGTTVVATMGNVNTANSAFTAKYDSVGNLLWTSRNAGDVIVYAIAGSSDGFYSGGRYNSTQMSFYDDNGQIVSSMGNINTSQAGFIAKYTGSTTAQAIKTINNSVTFSTAGLLSISGSLQVTGSLSVSGTKNFLIPHPVPEKRELGYMLRHSALETPTRGDNLYRFTVLTQNNVGSVELPDYFPYLNENVQVFVTANGILGYGRGKYNGEINTADIEVSQDGMYNILVIGTRKDTGALVFDNLGVEYLQ